MQVWLLCDDGIRRWFGIHRLIAEAFIPNPNNLPVAHHLDHDKLNNDPSNLKWVSHRDNIRYAIEAGRHVSAKGLSRDKFATKQAQIPKLNSREPLKVRNARSLTRLTMDARLLGQSEIVKKPE